MGIEVGDLISCDEYSPSSLFLGRVFFYPVIRQQGRAEKKAYDHFAEACLDGSSMGLYCGPVD